MIAKRLAESVLGSLWLDRIVARWMQGSHLILAYHNVVPDSEAGQGDAALHMPLSRFREHLDLLADRSEVVPLTAIGQSGARRGSVPKVAVTFDDAYRGAVVLAGAELRSRGIPATFFVPPKYVEEGAGFWWDVAAPRFAARRDWFLETLGGRDDAIQAWIAETGERGLALGHWFAAASPAELSDIAGEGITFGSHSWSHASLDAASLPDLQRELELPIRWLRERYGCTIDWLAYPYGRTSPLVSQRAQAAGYVRAVLIRGGWVRGTLPTFDLPRFNVPAGLSAAGLAVRLNGIRTGG